MTESPLDVMQQQWYAVPDTLIGGWSVSNVDKPTHAQDPRRGEVEIANFVEERVARYMARLHNAAMRHDAMDYTIILLRHRPEGTAIVWKAITSFLLDNTGLDLWRSVCEDMRQKVDALRG